MSRTPAPAPPLTSRPRPVTPVGILAAQLDGLSRLAGELEAEGRGSAELSAGLREAVLLAAGLEEYAARCTTPESPALAQLARRTAQEDWSGPGPLEQEMLSGHVEGRLLDFLVHATGAARVLEIGMFTGYSALAMAQALPPGGSLVACEVDARAAAIAQECFAASRAGAAIRVEVGPALDTLRRLDAAGESFDLVFVDADKAGYAAYLDLLLESGLLAAGALVCVDNTLLQGEPWLPGEPSANARAIADFNAGLVADPRVVQVLLPVRDGVTLVRRV